MAIYYISPDGSDSNNGLGPDASHGSNKPWLTLGKALGAAGLASGDTVYIAPGTYRATTTVAMTSATVETRIIGDPRNELGFKNSVGVLRSAGFVSISAWTTDDKTAPSSSTLLDLAGRDFLTFENIIFQGGTGVIISATTAMSTNIKFRKCVFHNPAGSGNATINWTGGITANVALVWHFDKCKWFTWGGYSITAQNVPNSGSADWDLDVLVTNCEIFQLSNTSAGIYISKAGAGSFFPGGIKFQNCSVFTATWCILMQNGWSTSIPLTIYNSIILTGGSSAALSADTLGNLVEDNNLIKASTARSNVAVGAKTKTAYSLMCDFGQNEFYGFVPRSFGMPLVESPILGFGTDSSVTLTDDLLGRSRPSGPGYIWNSGAKSVGCYEYHDFGRENTGDATLGSCLELKGPGDHEFFVPVSGGPTNLSYKVKYDLNYGGSNYPQLRLMGHSGINVTGQTLSGTNAASGNYQTLSFSTFTPSRKTFVKVRLESYSTIGSGKVFLEGV